MVEKKKRFRFYNKYSFEAPVFEAYLKKQDHNKLVVDVKKYAPFLKKRIFKLLFKVLKTKHLLRIYGL